MNETHPLEFLYPEFKAGGFSRCDGTIQFYLRINALIAPNMTVVDLGAGRGANCTENRLEFKLNMMNLRGKCKKVIGIDIDPAVLNNPSLDEARLISSGGSFPIADNSVDLIICDYTFEHVNEPQKLTSEIGRILVTGGWICARTPNKWGYIGIGARLIPRLFHARLLQWAQPRRKKEDIFPKAYRMNTSRILHKYFPVPNWNIAVYSWEAEPAYFGSNRVVLSFAKYLLSWVPDPLGSVLFFFGQKLK